VGRRTVVVPVLLAVCILAAGTSSPNLRDGDIVFHTSRSNQSDAIRRATKSPFTHMGMVFIQGKRPLVLEAVGPVKWTPLEQWVQQGVDNHYVVKRLADPVPLRTPGGVARLRTAAIRFLGKPYDPYFEWSDDRIYCSELVWKAYKNAFGIEIGTLEHLRDFDLGDPVVAAKLKERFGAAVPKEETVISPATMFRSEALTTVYEQ
jgi:hypothetical protein